MKEIVKHAFSYLDVIVKPPLSELGGLLEDQMKFVRYKSQLRLINKVEEIHKKRNITPKQIPLKLAYNLVNEASWEEDQSLQNMWAELMANASDSNNEVDYHHVLVKILSELSAEEAKILNYKWSTYTSRVNIDDVDNIFIQIGSNDIHNILSGKDAVQVMMNGRETSFKSDLILSHFQRLGLVVHSTQSGLDSRFGFRLTTLCILLLKECTKKEA